MWRYVIRVINWKSDITEGWDEESVEDTPGNLNKLFGYHLVIFGDCETKKNVLLKSENNVRKLLLRLPWLILEFHWFLETFCFFINSIMVPMLQKTET